jgi:argininosuccinate synthase
VSGKIEVKLYKGNVEILKREPKHSLFAPELRSVKRAGFDQREAEGAVRLFALPFRLYSEKGM